MAQPTPYERLFDFTGFSTDQPNVITPGVKLDEEYNGIQLTLSEVLRNLALIQRDDGKLADGAVTLDALTAEAIAAIAAGVSAGSGGVSPILNIISVYSYMTGAEQQAIEAGDFSVNVTDALTAASAALQARGSGTLVLPPGGYLVGKQTFHGDFLDGTGPAAYGPQEIITVKNAGHVRVVGYGAVLKTDPTMRYGSFDPVTGERFDPVLPFYDYSYYAYPYRGVINFESNESVTIEGVELDGNNENIILGGHWGDSQWQLEGHGLHLANNRRVTVRNVNSHNHPGDGCVLSAAGLALNEQPLLTVFENYKARYNGRQGISLVGGRNIVFINCDLSYTGRALNNGEQFLTYPAAGIDIEAEGAIIRDVLFINPYMVGNVASGLNAASGNSGRVRVVGGLIEGLLIQRFGYSFDHVTFLGKTQIALPATNQYKAASADVTLTIAGAGPYTVTRSAGSFIDDDFAAGAVVRLSGALNAANTGKSLMVKSLTATELTVRTVDGSAMVAEGPIAACAVATATTEEDGARFNNCIFSHDVSLTEEGVFQNPDQSTWQEALWAKFKDCIIDTGDQPLPSGSISAVADSHPTFENCEFRSAYSGAIPVARHGRYRGVNRFVYDGTLILDIGTNSIVDYGAVYVNGAAV